MSKKDFQFAAKYLIKDKKQFSIKDME